MVISETFVREGMSISTTFDEDSGMGCRVQKLHNQGGDYRDNHPPNNKQIYTNFCRKN